jgi:hypothetical protein
MTAFMVWAEVPMLLNCFAPRLTVVWASPPLTVMICKDPVIPLISKVIAVPVPKTTVFPSGKLGPVRLTLPLLIFNVPVKVTVPPITKVPTPVLVKLPVPEIVPLNVKGLEEF